MNVLEVDDFSMEDLNKIVGEEFRSGPTLRLVFFQLAVALTIIGFIGIVLGLQTIPTAAWANFSGWIAVIVGGVVTAIIIHSWLRLMPSRARRSRRPPEALNSHPSAQDDLRELPGYPRPPDGPERQHHEVREVSLEGFPTAPVKS